MSSSNILSILSKSFVDQRVVIGFGFVISVSVQITVSVDHYQRVLNRHGRFNDQLDSSSCQKK
jgi:hypothetical protein